MIPFENVQCCFVESVQSRFCFCHVLVSPYNYKPFEIWILHVKNRTTGVTGGLPL